ncbi:MAG: phosphoribosylformylglycinamidine cyclo-ligase [Planctomycetota bacterium]|nr:phosphoribosylformylglycinamidine cyclo-ligase [Planctomycetota bacterium]
MRVSPVTVVRLSNLPMSGLSYKDSGVDLDVYNEAMKRLPSLMHRTFSPRVRPLDGGFAGLFQLDFYNRLFRRNYEDPMLVACTDGVGTKLKLAQLAGRSDTVGIDLVAMCVNDAICCGAEPLFFLDYVAMSHDDPVVLEQIVRGISDGCLQSDCALLGGETAIMPDLYQPGDYDLAGFCVGVVERKHLIDGKTIAADDVVIGVASSGIHSNGFSLVRKIVLEAAGKKLSEPFNESQTFEDVLLEPTVIYAKAIREVLNHYKVKCVVHGIAHVTGGGLAENIERILPEGVQVEIDASSWERPPIFEWLQENGNVATDEMFRVFNMGIGLAVIVSPYYADMIRRLLDRNGLKNWVIGSVTAGEKSVTVKNQ